MGFRKLIRWTSHRNNNNGANSTTKTSRNSNACDETQTQRQPRSIRQANPTTPKRLSRHTVSGFPLRTRTYNEPDEYSDSVSHASTSLYSHYGIDQSKRQMFSPRPNKRCQEAPKNMIIDSDFLNDDSTPSESMKSKPEMFSRASLGYNAPVCESYPHTAKPERDGDRCKAGLGAEVSSDERPKNLNATYKNFSEASFRVGRLSDCSDGYDYAPTSANSRLGELGKLNLYMQDPVARLDQSMIEIDRAFDAATAFGEVPSSDCDYTAASPESPNSRGSECLRAPCAMYLESAAATSSAKNDIEEPGEEEEEEEEEEKKEDPFLYLAWTSMPTFEKRYRRRSSRRETVRNPCPLPLPPPEIAAANARIASFKRSPIAFQLETDIAFISSHECYDDKDAIDDMPVIEADLQARQRIEDTSASAAFREMLQDAVFVRMYTDEMKAKCKQGVWWEGWLVVHELSGRGVTASS